MQTLNSLACANSPQAAPNREARSTLVAALPGVQLSATIKAATQSRVLLPVVRYCTSRNRGAWLTYHLIDRFVTAAGSSISMTNLSGRSASWIAESKMAQRHGPGSGRWWAIQAPLDANLTLLK